MNSITTVPSNRKLKVVKLHFDGSKFAETETVLNFSDIKSMERQTYYKNHLLVKMMDEKDGEITILDNIKFLDDEEKEKETPIHGKRTYPFVSFRVNEVQTTAIYDIKFHIDFTTHELNPKELYRATFLLNDPDPYHATDYFELIKKVDIDGKGICAEVSTHVDESILNDFPEIQMIQSKVYEKFHWESNVSIYNEDFMRRFKEFLAIQCNAIIENA